MEKFFKKIKSAFPKAIVQYEKNYVSFTFGGGLYYQLRVQKDKVRMMATNYPNKAKLGECLKIIRKNNIEGKEINGKEILFEIGVKNPEIFTLRLEIPYTGTKLENDKFNAGIVDSCAKFHVALLPLVNAFVKQPVGDLYSLMGGKTTPVNTKVEQVKAAPKKVSAKPKVTLQQQLADALIEHFPDAIIKKIDTDNYLDIHLPSVHQKKGTHLGINTAKELIKIVFYCREDEFNEQVLANSKKIEAYAQGLRIKDNPTFNTIEKAIDASVDFVKELKRATSKTSKKTTSIQSKKQPLKENVIKPAKEGSDFKSMIRAYKAGDLKKVADLVDKGNRPLQFNQDDSVIENELIAVCAAEEVDLDVLKRIIKEGGDLNARNNDEDKYTAVHYCAWDGKTKALTLLLKSGALPDIVGADGRTPFHLATAMGHSDAVEMLIKAGVDIDRRIPDGNKYYSKKGATALREALINQRWEVVDLLLGAEAEITSLTELCVEDYKGKKDLFDVIKLLAEDGEYSDGDFDEEKLNELENRVKGIASEDEEKDDEAESVEELESDEEEDSNEYDIEKFLRNLRENINKIGNKDAEIQIPKHHAAYWMVLQFVKDNDDIENALFLEKIVSLDCFGDDLKLSEIKSIKKNIDNGVINENVVIANLLNTSIDFRKELLADCSAIASKDDLIDDTEEELLNKFGDLLEISDYSDEIVELFQSKVEKYKHWIFDEQEEDQEEDDDIENEVDEKPSEEDFFIGKTYEKQYIRFLEIAGKTGILINEIKVEPTPKERNELWEIIRVFADRIYQIDDEKSPDKNELNTLCFNAIVGLHWCDIYITDERFSRTNGRFRRDTLALALCFYARIDRSYNYYDHVKLQFIMPHMQFSVLLWSVNSIVNLGQDNLFGIFTQDQAQKAQQLFIELDNKNQASGGYGVVAPDKMPDNHPLKGIWNEVFSLFKNVRIPFQFIRNYISLELPKRSFIQNLLSKEGKNIPGVNVTLLDIDKQKNIAFLDRQIEHKQFPADWIFVHDIAFVSIYFATTTDGVLDNEEMNIILTQIGEWINEADQKKLKKLSTDAFNKAKEQFNKDKSNDRFSFALENIRRHVLVQKKYDIDETKKQLQIILNDLLAIAEADDIVKSEEVDLVVAIRDNWGIVWDSGKEQNDNVIEVDEKGMTYAELARLLLSYGVESEIELTSITPDQAQNLVKYKGILNLSGLTNISEKVAEILASHSSNLILDGITNLSDIIISKLAKHKGGYLSLDGLTSISEISLDALAHNNEQLFLNGLTTLTDREALIIAAHKNSLTLDGVNLLSERAFESLSKHQGGYLSLDGIISMSDKALEYLAKHDGQLYLNGLLGLTDKGAELLSKHKGGLNLNRINTLSDKAALALSKYEGELSLNGLTSLSDKAAKALSVKGIEITRHDGVEDNEQDVEETEQNDLVIKEKISDFYCDNVWNREDYDLDMKPFPDVIRNQEDLDLLFRKFTTEEVDLIVKKIKKTKTYILLPFIKEILGRDMDLSSYKPPFWFIPIVAYGNNISSILYFNQDGIYNTFKNSSSLSMAINVDVWKSISVEPGYNGLFDDDSDDENLSSLKIDWYNPNSGNSGATNVVEFHGEEYGSSLMILKAIWDSAWKTVVDRSRGTSQFLLGPPPNVESFNNWDELIEWAKKK